MWTRGNCGQMQHWNSFSTLYTPFQSYFLLVSHILLVRVSRTGQYWWVIVYNSLSARVNTHCYSSLGLSKQAFVTDLQLAVHRNTHSDMSTGHMLDKKTLRLVCRLSQIAIRMLKHQITFSNSLLTPGIEMRSAPNNSNIISFYFPLMWLKHFF